MNGTGWQANVDQMVHDMRQRILGSCSLSQFVSSEFAARKFEEVYAAYQQLDAIG